MKVNVPKHLKSIKHHHFIVLVGANTSLDPAQNVTEKTLFCTDYHHIRHTKRRQTSREATSKWTTLRHRRRRGVERLFVRWHLRPKSDKHKRVKYGKKEQSPGHLLDPLRCPYFATQMVQSAKKRGMSLGVKSTARILLVKIWFLTKCRKLFLIIWKFWFRCHLKFDIIVVVWKICAK